MQGPALFDQLILLLRTSAEVSSVILCMEEFTGSFYSGITHEQQQQIFKKLSPKVSLLLNGAFAKELITPANQIGIKRQIDELTDQLRTSKKLQMTLAFQPDDETITIFSDWVKKNVNKEMVLELHFDKSIVGGVVIISGGEYKDYSVRKNLSNRFQIQREEILGLLS